jgi:threonine dehydrogenase-like Zn-dependent dehydrogenase
MDRRAAGAQRADQPRYFRGGAKVVLATAANSDAITATVDGLRPRGELVVIGVTPPRWESARTSC